MVIGKTLLDPESVGHQELSWLYRGNEYERVVRGRPGYMVLSYGREVTLA